MMVARYYGKMLKKQLNTICTMSISIYIMLKAVVMIIPLKKSVEFFTLQDILDKLPCFIGKEVLTMQKLADSYTCLYMEPYSRSIIKITESKELIDAAYEMLCWCIENGYIKTNQI